MPPGSCFAYGAVTRCGASFHRLPLHSPDQRGAGPTTPGAASTAPVWANARSLATTCAIIVIFSSSGYLDVSVPRVRPPQQLRCGGIPPAGFPHSDIRGSQGICPSPRLFAACHVLRRLREPQASPMRPFCLSLVPSKQTDLHCPLAGAPGPLCRAFSTYDITVVARSLYQLDFFASISRLAALHPALAGRESGSLSLYSLRSQHVNDLYFSFSP